MRWDGSTCAALTTAHKEGKITALALSPDGKVLATGSSEVRDVCAHVVEGRGAEVSSPYLDV